MSASCDEVLAINAGSSSLKFALYPRVGQQVDAARLAGHIDGLEPGGTPLLHLSGPQGASQHRLQSGADRFGIALGALEQVLAEGAPARIGAIAHRIVHGGAHYADSVLLDDTVLDVLAGLSPLAPLHQPHNLAGVHAFRRHYPGLPQVGCFDTAFHASLPQVEQMFALPQALRDAGVRRYGFHGLSYRYVTEQLRLRVPRAGARLLIAHLGNGASACAVAAGKSVATTMGFSALDGLMMGTRSGAIDPGVLLHLMGQGYTHDDLERLLYRESGLRGVSGVSADMRALHASDAPGAALAIDMFVHRLVRECGALTACLGGVDVIAFTGGIGEHDVALRQRACAALAYLGVRLDPAANEQARGSEMAAIHGADSAVEVWVVPTDEGRVAAADAVRLLSQGFL